MSYVALIFRMLFVALIYMMFLMIKLQSDYIKQATDAFVKNDICPECFKHVYECSCEQDEVDFV